MLSVATVALPYVAGSIFLAGVAWRLWQWARTPVPFRIPTTAGQQRSLAFIEPGRLDGASTRLGVVGRVFLEVLFFRSLFRDTGHRRHPNGRLAFPERTALWAAAIAFHWSLLVILVRHLRLVTEPVPALVSGLAAADAFFQLGTPSWYVSDVLVLGALAFLLARRLRDPLLRYLTQPADYLALGLLLAIVASGIVMRYAVRSDVVAIKAFALGVVSFHPVALPGGGAWMTIHLLLVCALAAVFPFGKLMHGAAPFLTPTRALANDNRRVRHVNPWNPSVAVHTYAEWEEEFRDKIVAAGLPTDTP